MADSRLLEAYACLLAAFFWAFFCRRGRRGLFLFASFGIFTLAGARGGAGGRAAATGAAAAGAAGSALSAPPDFFFFASVAGVSAAVSWSGFFLAMSVGSPNSIPPAARRGEIIAGWVTRTRAATVRERLPLGGFRMEQIPPIHQNRPPLSVDVQIPVPPGHSFEWINPFDMDELRDFQNEVYGAFRSAMDAGTSWNDFEAVLHEWHESAIALRSDTLASAFRAGRGGSADAARGASRMRDGCLRSR